MSTEVIIYTTTICPYCVRAKELLNKRSIPFKEIDVSNDTAKRSWLVQAAGGRKTVPQIFINGEAIGGCDDLYALDSSGELSKKIAAETR